jgi:hypothetical protein
MNMLYSLSVSVNKFIGLYNLKYFLTTVEMSLIFKTPLINKPWTETGASELYSYHINWQQLYKI